MKFFLLLFLIFSFCEEQKPKVAIATFKIKAPKYKLIDATGTAYADMLVDALVNTQEVIVLEREILKEIEEEIEIGKGEKFWEGADYLVFGSIVGFEPDYKGWGIKLKYCCLAGGFILVTLLKEIFKKETKEVEKAVEDMTAAVGEAEVGIKESYIAIHLRVVEVKTRKVVASKHIEVVAKDVYFGGEVEILKKNIALASMFKKYKNTPMEKAIYESLRKAVLFLTETIKKSRGQGSS